MDAITLAAQAQVDADEARLRSEMTRAAFLAGHFPEFIESEYQRTKAEYENAVKRRQAFEAQPTVSNPTGP